jgi:predicted transcriptional regulator
MSGEREWSRQELAELRRVLADLFPREADQRLFIADVGLVERTIEFHPTAENTWFSILEQARLTIGLENLLRHALATDRGRNNRTLRRIAEGGRPAAVLVTAEEFAAYREHRRFVDAVNEGLADVEAGRVLTTDELKASLEAEFGSIAWR